MTKFYDDLHRRRCSAMCIKGTEANGITLALSAVVLLEWPFEWREIPYQWQKRPLSCPDCNGILVIDYGEMRTPVAAAL